MGIGLESLGSYYLVPVWIFPILIITLTIFSLTILRLFVLVGRLRKDIEKQYEMSWGNREEVESFMDTIE